MGAKDLFKSLFFPKSKQVKKAKKKVGPKKTHLKVVPKPKPNNSQTLLEKKEIELLKQKISDRISSPEGSKKAALIIEKMLNKK